MKKLALKASIALASIAALGSVHAADGTITFTGDVVTSTCTVEAGGSSLTVPLGSVSNKNLKAIGDKAGRTGFSVSVSGCATTGTGAPTQIGLAFEPGASVNPVTNQLTAGTGADKATGVEIAVLNDKHEKILLGKPMVDSKSQFVTLSADGKATLNYSAEYVATSATVTPGKVAAALTYSLTYP